MGLVIVDSVTPNQQAGVDATPRALRSILYGPDGNPVTRANTATVDPTTAAGVLLAGVDHRAARLIRVNSDGSQRGGAENTLFLYDEAEGSAVNTNTWVQTSTTQTIAQAAGVITFNSGSSVATTTGAMHVSHRLFPYVKRGGLVFRCRARATAHFANNQLQLGFGSPTAATAVATPNGAFWRKDGTGQLVPVLSIGGSETLGTPISDVTFRAAVATSDFAIFEVYLEQTRATFRILLSNGTSIAEQIVDIPVSSSVLQSTHLNAFVQCCNTGATGTAVQLLVDGVAVWGTDGYTARPWAHAMAGMGLAAVSSPTAYTQLATYANSAAPANATLSNTAAGYATLGGLFAFAAVAGAETDYAIFALQIPTPYSLYITGIQISAFNFGAAVATTPTLLTWAIAVNSSAVSLATAATYPPMRIPLGTQSFAIGAAVGTNAPDVVRTFQTPIVCFPSRFVHIILRMPVGTATASQVARGSVSVDGFFE